MLLRFYDLWRMRWIHQKTSVYSLTHVVASTYGVERMNLIVPHGSLYPKIFYGDL